MKSLPGPPVFTKATQGSEGGQYMGIVPKGNTNSAQDILGLGKATGFGV
jgi:hypothetical protein